MENVKEWQTNH